MERPNVKIQCAACGLPKCKKTMQHLSVVFHKFPSDPNQRKLWEEFAGKSGEAICSRHFDESCYFVNDVDLQQRRRLLRNSVPTITIRDDGVDELFGYISSRSKSAKQIVYDVQPTTSFQSTPTNCWFEWVGSDSEHRPGEVQSYVPDCPEIPAVAQKPFQAEEPVPVPHAVHANDCDLPIVFESVASPYRCLDFGTREPGDAGCDISLDSILPVALADVHRPAGEQQVKAVIPLSEPYVTQAAVDATFGGQAHATAQPHVADRGTSGNKRDKLTIQTQRATLQKLRQEVCMLKAKLQLTSRQLRNKDTELAAQKALIDQMKKDHLHQLQQQQHQFETDFKEKFRNIDILKM